MKRRIGSEPRKWRRASSTDVVVVVEVDRSRSQLRGRDYGGIAASAGPANAATVIPVSRSIAVGTVCGRRRKELLGVHRSLLVGARLEGSSRRKRGEEGVGGFGSGAWREQILQKKWERGRICAEQQRQRGGCCAKMLRCAGTRVVRVISARAASVAPALVERVATGGGDGGPFLQQEHRRSGGARSVSSVGWFNPSFALSDSHGGAGTSGNFGIATGLELEELEAQQKGLKRFDLDAPSGPFGTKEHPAIVESQYDERIVGCSGGVGEDEHDVVWFKLRKGETYECSLCTQAFQLKVVGEGGMPGAHH